MLNKHSSRITTAQYAQLEKLGFDWADKSTSSDYVMIRYKSDRYNASNGRFIHAVIEFTNAGATPAAIQSAAVKAEDLETWLIAGLLEGKFEP